MEEGKEGPLAKIRRALPFGKAKTPHTPSNPASISERIADLRRQSERIKKLNSETDDLVDVVRKRDHDRIRQVQENQIRQAQGDAESSRKLSEKIQQTTEELRETAGRQAEKGIESARRNIDELKNLPPFYRPSSNLNQGRKKP